MGEQRSRLTQTGVSPKKPGQAGKVSDNEPLEWKEFETGLCLVLTEEMAGEALEQRASGASALYHPVQLGPLGVAPR
jgi:hypothetical protein